MLEYSYNSFYDILGK